MPPRHNRPLNELAGAAAFNLSEAQAVVGCGRDTILTAIQQRQLRTRRLAGRRVILKTDLNKWLENLPDDADDPP